MSQADEDVQTSVDEAPLPDHLVVLVVFSRTEEAAVLAAAVVPADGANHLGTITCMTALYTVFRSAQAIDRTATRAFYGSIECTAVYQLGWGHGGK